MPNQTADLLDLWIILLWSSAQAIEKSISQIERI